MLRSARNKIESAFRRLKARILIRAIDIHLKYVPNIMFACFTLHNICEKQKVSVDPVVFENIIIEERRNANKVDKLNSYTIAARGKVRETLTDYFK